MRKRLGFLTAVLFVTGILSAGALTTAKAETILGELDALRNFSNTDFSAVMTMVTEDPEKGIDKIKVQQFRRDGRDMFLMLFLEPESKKGQGYLRINDNLWFYDPESRKFNHTSMKDSFGSTDARHSDFRISTLKEDYQVQTVTDGELGRFSVYIMDLKAKNSEVTYPRLKLWVTRKGHLPLKVEDYSASNRLMRTSYYPKYAKIKDRYIATVMIFVDELVKGRKTQISITDISTKKLPDTIFTKSYVERVNR